MLLFFFPEGEIFLEELNDGLGISEGLFIDIIDLLESHGKGFLSELTGLSMVVHNFVMEHREIESKSKGDWIAGIEGLALSLGLLVVLEGSALDTVELIWSGTFGNVSIVVTSHLVEEGFALIGGGLAHALILDDFDDG